MVSMPSLQTDIQQYNSIAIPLYFVSPYLPFWGYNVQQSSCLRIYIGKEVWNIPDKNKTLSVLKIGLIFLVNMVIN